MSAEGEEASRDRPRLIGPHARGVSLDVLGHALTKAHASTRSCKGPLLLRSPPPSGMRCRPSLSRTWHARLGRRRASAEDEFLNGLVRRSTHQLL